MKENKRSVTIKQILITLLIIFLITFLIHVVRNMIIIKTLANKANEMQNVNNYHISVRMHSDENFTVTDIWFKDGKYLENLYMTSYDEENNKAGEDKVAITYYDGKSDFNSTFYKNTKEVVNQNMSENESIKVPMIQLSGMGTVKFYSKDFLTLLRSSILMKISSEKSFDKDCYRMRFMTDPSNVALYVDKETGLTIRNCGVIEDNNLVRYSYSDFKYDINNVTDDNLNFEKIIEK